jgi:hypothetical protein
VTRTPGCTCSLSRRAWRDDGTCGRCGNRVLETQIQDVVLDTMISDRACCLWRNNIGTNTHLPSGDRRKRPIEYGVGNPGGADLLGLRDGVPLAVETKTVRGRLSPDQRAFARAWTDRRGVYAVIRSEADAHQLLAYLRGGPRPEFVFCSDDKEVHQ